MNSTSMPSIRLPGLRDEIPVVHADAHVLALDKPAGLLSVPDRWDADRPNLAGLIRQSIERGADWCARMNIREAANVHRIDADTSGLILFALDRESLHGLVRQFRGRSVGKTYHALVHGNPGADRFDAEQPVVEDPRRPGFMKAVRSGGRAAVTRFEVVERFRGYALVCAVPETGRQHQIRVHLKASGHPIVGDEGYGGAPLLLSGIKRKYRESASGEKPLLGRQALHASSLRFTHPATGEAVRLDAALARDMQVALKYLRRYAS